MSNGKNGIPTTYHNYKFRSRLEATWACFFDRVGWKWKYEPFDYDGYIPDFVLLMPFGNVLVEVKPALSMDELKPHAEKINQSSWAGEALIVGVGLIDSGDTYLHIGWFGEKWQEGLVWGVGNLHWCGRHMHYGFHSLGGAWWCRHGPQCDHHQFCEAREELEKHWALAQNMVQWAPKMFGLADAASR